MNKIWGTVVVLSLLVAGGAFAQGKAKDGLYFAEDEAYAANGWKDQVVVTVAGGKITAVNWNAVSDLGLADKKTVAGAGKYGLIKASKLKLEWDAQANNVAAYVVKTQDTVGKFTKEGLADGIAGASIHVNGFFGLLNKALAAGPVAKGTFKKDGWFYVTQADFDPKTGWKDDVVVTVVNGTIVDVVWNGVSKDPKIESKIRTSVAGLYGMEKAAKQGPWHVQAARVDAAIVQAGDPAKIPLKADGTTDAITGATLHPTAVTLAAEALKADR